MILIYQKTHFLPIYGVYEKFSQIDPPVFLVNKLLAEHQTAQLDTPCNRQDHRLNFFSKQYECK